ncbi:MAG TPA: hypothetical protein VHO69_11080, partial [Phototrophicaceae bacterium]|nr:hypothetical protein [Phototrophicaceae bacterium]
MLYRHIFLFTIGVLALVFARPTSIQAQDCSLVNVNRVSVASDGTQTDDNSDTPALSANGRYIVFASHATNLVVGDYGFSDIFLHDRQEGTTTRITTASGDHAYTPAISADGQVVAFASANFYMDGDEYLNNYQDIISYNRQTAAFTRVSVASDGPLSNGMSYDPAISANGQVVAFSSTATNLVANDTNGYSDIFVRDLAAGTTTRVSVATGGAEASNQSYSPAISADGRYIAFTSYADNLVPNDNNPQHWDIFVHDRQNGETTRVSVASNGTQGNNYSGGRPAISADGHYVAFHSYASNLVPGDTNTTGDIFVRDWQSGQTTRVSVTSDGTQANEYSANHVALSADGRYVVFGSYASNLVPGDTNGTYD